STCPFQCLWLGTALVGGRKAYSVTCMPMERRGCASTPSRSRSCSVGQRALKKVRSSPCQRPSRCIAIHRNYDRLSTKTMSLQKRPTGGEQPSMLGNLKLRLPFIHYKLELPDILQGAILCVVPLSITTLMTSV